MKIHKVLIIIVSLALISISTVNATETVPENRLPEINYNNMNTHELEKEVEKLSQKGKLPFEMGIELMIRWSNGNT